MSFLRKLDSSKKLWTVGTFYRSPWDPTHVVYKAKCNKDQIIKKECSQVYSKNFKTSHILAIVKVHAQIGKEFMKKIAEKLLFSTCSSVTEACFVAQSGVTTMAKF